MRDTYLGATREAGETRSVDEDGSAQWRRTGTKLGGAPRSRPGCDPLKVVHETDTTLMVEWGGYGPGCLRLKRRIEFRNKRN